VLVHITYFLEVGIEDTRRERRRRRTVRDGPWPLEGGVHRYLKDVILLLGMILLRRIAALLVSMQLAHRHRSYKISPDAMTRHTPRISGSNESTEHPEVCHSSEQPSRCKGEKPELTERSILSLFSSLRFSFLFFSFLFSFLFLLPCPWAAVQVEYFGPTLSDCLHN
jgi:hypothetical protein